MQNLASSPSPAPAPGGGPHSSVVGKVRLISAWVLFLSYFYMVPLEFSALQWERTREGLWRVTEAQTTDPLFLLLYLLWLGTTFLGAFLFLVTGLKDRFRYERTRIEESIGAQDLAYYFAWVQILSMGFLIPYGALSEEGGWLSIVAPFLPHVLMLLLALFMFRHRLRRIGFSGEPFRRWVAIAVAIAAGYLFVYYALDPWVTEPVARFFSLEIQSWREDSISQGVEQAARLGWIYAVGQVLLLGVIGPIAEEVMFRGLLMGAFLQRIGSVGAVLLSSAIFALFHVDVVFLAPLFVMGLILGTLYALFKNLWAPILFHILNNTVSVIYDLLG
ncbi:CAAX protease self-immunity [Melghirimyces thermohalophilus]|uniref:CAAX protease self-immunity n=1 Tax=Melghirimyces thermohalophilus TaxID=1236220 RepID=A0A1G6QWD8_9BACL|nr:CPBP family intramembrane glutamic endopeptidase [Melghirimyces thermohalophilus]SDC96553.1 CAAX protease self-immunity [Melghirimyces thermohalophilus]